MLVLFLCLINIDHTLQPYTFWSSFIIFKFIGNWIRNVIKIVFIRYTYTCTVFCKALSIIFMFFPQGYVVFFNWVSLGVHLYDLYSCSFVFELFLIFCICIWHMSYTCTETCSILNERVWGMVWNYLFYTASNIKIFI